MRRMLVRAAAMLALVSAARAEPPVAAPPPEPYRLVRSIQVLQEQIAQGSESARAAQHSLLLDVGDKLLAADPAMWRRPVNAREAVIYVLSGGRPEILRRLLALEEPPPIPRDILEGVLAYGTGREAQAWKLLGEIDPRSLQPALGAYIALAQARLTMTRDPAAAARFLGTVRLLAPGTLLEEAALRRGMVAAGARSDRDGFLFLVGQYVRRFRDSAYAENFLHDVLDIAQNLGLLAGPGDVDALMATLAGLRPADRRDLYLALANRKLLAGDLDIARMAAEGAAALAGQDSAAGARARLYGAAAQVTGEDGAGALEALRAIDAASLSPEDAGLRDAAIALAREVQRPPEAASAPADASGDAPESALLTRGRQLLTQTDALLERTR